jgi:phage replication O-like protein O
MEDATTMQINWTAIPNEILDCMGNLGNAELRVLLAIYRKTTGYQKEADVISLTQFEQMTGLMRRHIMTAIDSLLAKNMITRTDAKRSSFSYKPVPLGNQYPKGTSTPREPVPVPLGNQLPVPLGHTQKKEKEKKERFVAAHAATPPSDISELSITTDTPTRKRKPKADGSPAAAPTPSVIRYALADGCAIDLDSGMATKSQVTSLGNSAKAG